MMMAILLLAAGRGRRMRGGDKLAEAVQGRALLRDRAEVALATGLPLLVALDPDHAARAGLLDGLALTRVAVAEAEEGMAASIRAGVAALPGGTQAMMLMLADMPEITTDDLLALQAMALAAPGRVIRATAADGRPGHPVLFPARLFPALAALSGDTGARAILREEAVLPCPLPAEHALTDLDTPEDWARWRAAR